MTVISAVSAEQKRNGFREKAFRVLVNEEGVFRLRERETMMCRRHGGGISPRRHSSKSYRRRQLYNSKTHERKLDKVIVWLGWPRPSEFGNIKIRRSNKWFQTPPAPIDWPRHCSFGIMAAIVVDFCLLLDSPIATVASALDES